MIARFFCPYCRASLDPAAMDAGCNERINLRICPACDTPVLLGRRDIQVATRLNLSDHLVSKLQIPEGKALNLDRPAVPVDDWTLRRCDHLTTGHRRLSRYRKGCLGILLNGLISVSWIS